MGRRGFISIFAGNSRPFLRSHRGPDVCAFRILAYSRDVYYAHGRGLKIGGAGRSPLPVEREASDSQGQGARLYPTRAA